MLINRLILAKLFLATTLFASAQRQYTTQSILATGTWARITIDRPGIYKIDLALLNNLGFSGSSLPSSSLRVFGNGGSRLAEAANGPFTDDLAENAIEVRDGGDGILNGSDYALFYAPGPHTWVKDSVNSSFHFGKNIYSDLAYYYITIGGSGLRINQQTPPGTSGITVSSFDGRDFHELDSINLLSSGQDWYGEEFSDAPGKTLQRDFNINIPNLVPGSALRLRSNAISRSVGNGSRLGVSIYNQPLGEIFMNPVGGGQYDPIAQAGQLFTSTPAGNSAVSISYRFFPGSFNAQGWLDKFELFSRRSLALSPNTQLLFRDWASVGNNTATFIISNATASTEVWEVTEKFSPHKIVTSFTGSTTSFTNTANRLREYVAFDPSTALIPLPAGKIINQNLHATIPAELIIIAHPVCLQEAERLAQLHRQNDQMRVLVTTIDQVYNEFSSGSPDPVAIRDFVKMYHDKLGNSSTDKLKYLLLFGDASFDFKNRISGNNNMVPTWENHFSLDPLSTYASDDFFGFLDNQDDINSGLVTNLLDIGIGRIPARNADEAKQFIDKAEAYYHAKAFGPWRQQVCFIADDEDGNLHLQDAEIISNTSQTAAPFMNLNKIYLDAYRQESGPGGSSYPDVNRAIGNQVYNGTLIMNYTGHGGARRLAEETVIDQEEVNQWNNPDQLPLMVTATCDFAPYDNPTLQSLGENLLLRPKTGAIALMTTTRVVFAFSNRVMNDNYMRFALEPGPNGKFRSLGDAMREAKNFTYQNSGDVANNRKFTLLGDPAITLAFPELNIRATRINNIPASQADTLKALDKVVIEGEVTDAAGTVLTGFNGDVYPFVYDKSQIVNTLGNDPGSPVTSFAAQPNSLFKGKASVINGRFSFTFRVPKDINYQFGNGRLSLYAADGTRDAGGLFTNFIVGGIGDEVPADNLGPEIRPYLNDEMFVNGGIVNQNPVLILKLADSSGINVSGTGIGHEILATLDNDNNKYFILNDFYQADQDSYQKGEARFQLQDLEPGPHSIRIRAWDVLNNSNEAVLEFIVAKDEELELSHVLNYPNPFTTHTNFWFEHNKPGQDLHVTIQIFTLSGRIIKRIKKTINTPGNRSSELEWDGKDDFGDKVGRGVYFYKISVSSATHKREKIEKIVIF